MRHIRNDCILLASSSGLVIMVSSHIASIQLCTGGPAAAKGQKAFHLLTGQIDGMHTSQSIPVYRTPGDVDPVAV